MTIEVPLKDGTILKCNDTRLYDKSPTGHFIIDNEKNIGFYVDKIIYPSNNREIKKEDKKYTKNIDDGWGYMMTYILHNEIKFIRLRIKDIEDMIN